MALFSTKKPAELKSEKRVLGAYVPEPLSNLVQLYSMATGVSKGVLISSLLNTWKENLLKTGCDEQYLIEKIIQKVQCEITAKNLTETQVLVELQKKKLSTKIINQITTSLIYGTYTQNPQTRTIKSTSKKTCPKTKN